MIIFIKPKNIMINIGTLNDTNRKLIILMKYNKAYLMLNRYITIVYRVWNLTHLNCTKHACVYALYFNEFDVFIIYLVHEFLNCIIISYKKL